MNFYLNNLHGDVFKGVIIRVIVICQSVEKRLEVIFVSQNTVLVLFSGIWGEVKVDNLLVFVKTMSVKSCPVV